MLLVDKDIAHHVKMGRLEISPWDPGMLQPASVDVRLAGEFVLFDNVHIIDPLQIPDRMGGTWAPPVGEPLLLSPGDFVLGATLERVRLPANLAARLEGKSTLGRLGLNIHSTAGFIDPGFDGTVTLEISNSASAPIKLWPGMKIGQLCFVLCTSDAARPYGSVGLGSRYQGQRAPRAARAERAQWQERETA